MFVSLIRANKKHINYKRSAEEVKYIRHGRLVEGSLF